MTLWLARVQICPICISISVPERVFLQTTITTDLVTHVYVQYADMYAARGGCGERACSARSCVLVAPPDMPRTSGRERHTSRRQERQGCTAMCCAGPGKGEHSAKRPNHTCLVSLLCWRLCYMAYFSHTSVAGRFEVRKFVVENENDSWESGNKKRMPRRGGPFRDRKRT